MMTIRWAALALLGSLMSTGPVMADGPISKAKNIADPNCTPAKAAKGAAMKATVGVGNRCGVAETARDTAGIDGKKNSLPSKGEKSDAAPGLLKPNSGD